MISSRAGRHQFSRKYSDFRIFVSDGKGARNLDEHWQ